MSRKNNIYDKELKLRPLKILKVIIFHKITNLVVLYNSNPHEIHV